MLETRTLATSMADSQHAGNQHGWEPVRWQPAWLGASALETSLADSQYAGNQRPCNQHVGIIVVDSLLAIVLWDAGSNELS